MINFQIGNILSLQEKKIIYFFGFEYGFLDHVKYDWC